MKTDLAPRHTLGIGNETTALWFQKSNRYVIVAENLYHLISLFLSVDTKNTFLETIKVKLNLDHTSALAIFNDIAYVLESANEIPKETPLKTASIHTPKCEIKNFYRFHNNRIQVNFQSELIESVIHPQIAHHIDTDKSNCDVVFTVFKHANYLYLTKNETLVGRYLTENFHLLQGRFALELANAIHHKHIENWIATFHASTISNGKESIMIIGDSGNGKSTLSALLMAHGFDLLADDFTPMYEDMNLYRYPAAISIKKGAFNTLEPLFKNFKHLTLHTNGPKKVNLKYLPPCTNFETSKSHFECHKIVLVKFDTTKPSELKVGALEHLLETLIPDSWISPNDTHALYVLNWIKDLKCYQLNYSDTNFAIANFKSLFDS